MKTNFIAQLTLFLRRNYPYQAWNEETITQSIRAYYTRFKATVDQKLVDEKNVLFDLSSNSFNESVWRDYLVMNNEWQSIEDQSEIPLVAAYIFLKMQMHMHVESLPLEITHKLLASEEVSQTQDAFVNCTYMVMQDGWYPYTNKDGTDRVQCVTGEGQKDKTLKHYAEHPLLYCSIEEALGDFYSSYETQVLQENRTKEFLDCLFTDNNRKFLELLNLCAQDEKLKEQFCAILKIDFAGIPILHRLVGQLTAANRTRLYSTIPMPAILFSQKDLDGKTFLEIASQEFIQYFLNLPQDEIRLTLQEVPLLWLYLFMYSFEDAMNVLEYASESLNEGLLAHNSEGLNLFAMLIVNYEPQEIIKFYKETNKIIEYPKIFSQKLPNGSKTINVLADTSYDEAIEILKALYESMSFQDFASICEWNFSWYVRGISMLLLTFIQPTDLEELLRHIILRGELKRFAADVLNADEDDFNALHAVVLENEKRYALPLLDVLKKYLPHETFIQALALNYDNQNVLEALSARLDIFLDELQLRYLTEKAEAYFEECDWPPKRKRDEDDSELLPPAKRGPSLFALSDDMSETTSTSEYQNWSTFFSLPSSPRSLTVSSDDMEISSEMDDDVFSDSDLYFL